MEKYSFLRGLNQVNRGDAPKAKQEIMDFLDIHTRAAWHKRLNGQVEPKVSEKEGIEEILVRYGAKKTKIWGTTEKIPC